ncbi:MAG: DUF4131 domain-containing protein, partial [Sphingomonadales bacterium]
MERLRKVLAEAATWRDLPLWLPVFLGVGILVYFALPGEPHRLAGVVVVGLAGLALARMRRTAMAPVLILLLAVAAGFLNAQVRSAMVAAPYIVSATGVTGVEGNVVRWEAERGAHGRLTLEHLTIDRLEPAQTPARIRIAVRTGGDTVLPGDRVRLRAVLDPVPVPAFPGDFDYARTLYFERIGALGFSVTPLERIVGATAVVEPRTLRVGVEGLRGRVSTRIRHHLPGDGGGVADAVITG